MRHISVTQPEPQTLSTAEIPVRSGRDAAVASFDWLANKHLDASYRLALAIVKDPAAAEDATHDAFLKAWQHWNELRDPERFEAWFMRILVNTCRDHLRRVSRVRDISADIQAADDEGRRADDRDAVGAALAQLSPDHRAAVALRYYQDLTVDDIALRLGVSAGTIKSRLHYALKHLSAVLGGTRDGGLR